MNNEAFLHSFQSVLPPHHLNQSLLNSWLLKAHEQSTPGCTDKLGRFAVNEKMIEQRYFECNDVDENWSSHQIYKLQEETPGGVDILERSLFFKKRAIEIFREFYMNERPLHVIHVTCTGYVSPSPAQVYFSSSEHKPTITHAYHMGCYASLPSIRIADALASKTGEEVDVVHTEMCSLHLNPLIHTPEQIVVQSLFADGHIKYTVGTNPKGLSLKIMTIKEEMIPSSEDDMTWIPSGLGMQMGLSREVPIKIRDALPEFVKALCRSAGMDFSDIQKNGVFAIHPGGPKIIEAVAKKLELSDSQISASQKVLRERGNMSSSTLPHVWQEILNSSPAEGTIILSLAFGPGLTIFGSLFEVAKK